MPKPKKPQVPKRLAAFKELVNSGFVDPTVVKAIRHVEPGYKHVAIDQVVNAFERRHEKLVPDVFLREKGYQMVTPELLLSHSTPTEKSQGINRTRLLKASKSTHSHQIPYDISRPAYLERFSEARKANQIHESVLAALRKKSPSEDARLQIGLALHKIKRPKGTPLMPEHVLIAGDRMPAGTRTLKSHDFFDYYWNHQRQRFKLIIPKNWKFDKENSMYHRFVFVPVMRGFHVEADARFRLSDKGYLYDHELTLRNVRITDAKGKTVQKAFDVHEITSAVIEFLEEELRKAYEASKK